MGIKNLSQVLGDEAPDSMKEHNMKSFEGRKIAIDASMSMYQFLIAVRPGQDGAALTNDVGETTRYHYCSYIHYYFSISFVYEIFV